MFNVELVLLSRDIGTLFYINSILQLFFIFVSSLFVGLLFSPISKRVLSTV